MVHVVHNEKDKDEAKSDRKEGLVRSIYNNIKINTPIVPSDASEAHFQISKNRRVPCVPRVPENGKSQTERLPKLKDGDTIDGMVVYQGVPVPPEVASAVEKLQEEASSVGLDFTVEGIEYVGNYEEMADGILAYLMTNQLASFYKLWNFFRPRSLGEIQICDKINGRVLWPLCSVEFKQALVFLYKLDLIRIHTLYKSDKLIPCPKDLHDQLNRQHLGFCHSLVMLKAVSEEIKELRSES